MKKFTIVALTAASLAAVGCKDSPSAPPLNAPTIEAVSGALTRTSLQPLATGVLAQDRSAVFGTFTYLTLAGIMGRDVYRIDASEPRYVQETLGLNPDPGSFAGSGGFAGFYTALRASTDLIAALPSAAPSEISDAEKSATSGFLKTLNGLEYLRLVELRDTVGVPIQSADAREVTPVSCKETVLASTASLLDAALAELNTAGGTTKLPFALPSGYTAHGRNYSLVSNLVLFNRGVKGKLDVLRAINRKGPNAAAAAAAVTELTQALGGAAAGAVPGSTFQNGPYYHFVASGSEATANPRADTKIGLNPLVKDSVQAGDERGSKIVSRTLISGGGISTTVTCLLCVNIPANQEAPVGILRDEELVLLRAQAYIETGNFAAATADLNSVRTFYGLAPYATFTTKAAAISAVLYEKRYSLLYEGPQRWVDLREYGRLNATYLRREIPSDPFNAAFPLPRTELNARNLTDNPACST